MPEIDISVVIVNYNVTDDVKKCVISFIRNSDKLSYEVIVVDNNSESGSLDELLDPGLDVTLIRMDVNRGFGCACNTGMKLCRGKYIFLVNPDIEFEKGTVKKLYEFMESESQAAVCAPVQYKPQAGIEKYYSFFPGIYSRLMQESRLYMTAPLMKYRFNGFWEDNISGSEPFKVDWVMGSCMMIRSDIFKTIGGFDEAFFLFEEETEWQFRMSKKGWKSFIVPSAKVLHNHHSSTSKVGKEFVYYHEFRSRLIFDSKRFTGLKYVFRRIMISAGLFFRVLYFWFRSLFNNILRIKYSAYSDLWKLSLRGKNRILNDRFNFDEKIGLFRN